MDLKGRKILVVGAARSGIAAANLAQQAGAVVKITDTRPLQDLEPALAGLKDRSIVAIEHGQHTPAFVRDVDCVVASPGVRRDALPLQWARSLGIPVWGEIEFAWRFCARPVIAVTGSNGKTTTSTLIAKVLEAKGRRVCLCGNVGVAFAQEVLSENVDVFVIEISSFQLELVETFRPFVAVITNFSQNHLDRHPDMQDYFDAKKRLFMCQAASDFAVLNAQDVWVRRIPEYTHAQVVWFNQDAQGNPNHAAVSEVARIMGIDAGCARRVCSQFPGVEHRMERVRVFRGVEYVNDSKATTAEAGRWALTLVPGPVIMICGGHDKGEIDLMALRDLVRLKVRKMIILTREDGVRLKLHAAFDGIVPLEDHTDMAAAVASACAQAVEGEKVLLSPMFASFDMFRCFEHRGEVFKEIVNRLQG